ncbi:DUF4157 domain-containing protein [Streptomyces sp. NBC_01622]|uniref:eCIS core domain-containing protein n=1 Tax=Streptomyces sp. NBC_01622 TaxID=2975903 RepID=UPI003868B7EE|nr:DUF4157 domain-containing protein [Streptomyces sp. NBC_01622]
MDFGHVRVHSGPVARRSAEELGTLAHTTGSLNSTGCAVGRVSRRRSFRRSGRRRPRTPSD